MCILVGDGISGYFSIPSNAPEYCFLNIALQKLEQCGFIMASERQVTKWGTGTWMVLRLAMRQRIARSKVLSSGGLVGLPC